MPEHVSITDPNIHEPKGVAAASADTIYVANGAASGTWQKIGTGSLDTSEFVFTNKYTINGTLTDISTASLIYLPVPVDSIAVSATFTLQGVITGADATLSFLNHAGATMATEVVDYSMSGAGETTTTSLSANNVFSAGERMTISTDGGSSTACVVFFTIVMQAT